MQNSVQTSQSSRNEDHSSSSPNPLQEIKENGVIKLPENEEYDKLSQLDRELNEELEKLKKELANGQTMKDTMNDLHEYNDIKDSAQIVLGAMAEMHKTTIAHLHKEYKLPMD